MLHNTGNSRNYDNGLAVIFLIVLVGISLFDCYLAWFSLQAHHPFTYTIVLAIAYLTHFICEIKRRKDQRLRRVLLLLPLLMALLPHLLVWYYAPSPVVNKPVEATFFGPEIAFSTTVFAAIEVLLDFWIKHINRRRGGRRGR